MTPIYLDHNATTPVLPEAWDAMRAAGFGNPASAHHAGRHARRALEDARERIAALLGAFPDEVVFTSGATEANNLAVFGQAGRAAASVIEHPCVVEPLRQLERRGFPVDWLPVDSRGVLLPPVVHPDTRLVCVMLANHETGALQPVSDIALSLPPGVALHCDAAQAVGKISVDFRTLGVATLSASAHKFGGPKGVGALLVKRGAKLAPQVFGGHQQQGRRPGTEPAPLAAGMAAALDVAVRGMSVNAVKYARFRARLYALLCEVASPVVVNGPRHRRTGRAGHDAERLVPRLPRRPVGDGTRPGGRGVFDRVRVFERVGAAQPGLAGDGRLGRRVAVGGPLQLRRRPGRCRY